MFLDDEGLTGGEFKHYLTWHLADLIPQADAG